MPCKAPKLKNQPQFPLCPGITGAFHLLCPWCKRELRGQQFGNAPTTNGIRKVLVHTNDPVRHMIKLGRAKVHATLLQPLGRAQPMQEWSKFAIGLLQDLYRKMLPLGPEAFCLCVAGSLARFEATPYSDLDIFMLAAREQDVRDLKQAGETIKMLLKTTQEVDWAMLLDPISIDPVRMCGTPSQVLAKAQEMQVSGLFHSIMNSRCILGSPQLLEVLKKEVAVATKNSLIELGYKDVKRAFTEFPPHKWSNQRVIVKSEIGRPLWLITNGLAKIYGIEVEGTFQQATKLLEKNKISSSVWRLIIDSHKGFELVRTHLHLLHRQEYEEVDISDTSFKYYRIVIDCLVNVNCLQNMAKSFTLTKRSFNLGYSSSDEFMTKDPQKFFVKYK